MKTENMIRGRQCWKTDNFSMTFDLDNCDIHVIEKGYKELGQDITKLYPNIYVEIIIIPGGSPITGKFKRCVTYLPGETLEGTHAFVVPYDNIVWHIADLKTYILSYLKSVMNDLLGTDFRLINICKNVKILSNGVIMDCENKILNMSDHIMDNSYNHFVARHCPSYDNNRCIELTNTEKKTPHENTGESIGVDIDQLCDTVADFDIEEAKEKCRELADTILKDDRFSKLDEIPIDIVVVPDYPNVPKKL